LKWFLLATTLIAVLIGTVGQQAYHQWKENAVLEHRAQVLRKLEIFGVRASKIKYRDENPHGDIVRLQFPVRVCQPKHFQWAADIGRLECIELNGTGFCDADAPTLLANPALKTLGLGGNAGVSDVTLGTLAQLESLERLDLGGTGISSQGLASLRPLRSLQFLSLRDTNIDDSGLQPIAALQKLDVIVLNNTRVRGAGFASLAKLPNLDYVMLSGCPLDDGAALAKLKQVSHLFILDSRIAPGILAHVGEMDNLRLLSLQGSGIGDAHLLELASAKQLTSLLLGKTKASEAALQELRERLPNSQIQGEPRSP
jgi:hypothetical protein